MRKETQIQLGALLIVAVVAVALVLGLRGTGTISDARSQTGETGIVRAVFTSEGHVVQPVNWRSWVFIGTPLTPNALNDGAAPFPEFHNVYMEPSAFEVYSRTGEFPEGTQIVKELVSVVSGDAYPDGSTDQVSGRGYFQSEYIGLELTVKDSERFPDEPGGWAYFSFGHKPEPYDATTSAQATATCNSCHMSNAAQDWVFTQFYPVLRATKSDLAEN